MGLRLPLRSEDPAALPESDDASGETQQSTLYKCIIYA
jgi:hypothetical protein